MKIPQKPLENLPFISFIIPIYNGYEATIEAFATLTSTLPKNLKHEIILVDDCSTDSRIGSWLRSLTQPTVKALSNPQNRGYAATVNRAAHTAKGEILALLNNDLIFTDGWLEPILEVFERESPHVGAVGNCQYRVSDGSLDHAGIEVTLNGKLEHITNIGTDIRRYRKAFAITGACLLIKRETFQSVDGLDETFINGCEDVDLCLKLRKKGFLNFVALNSKILHHVSLVRDRSSIQNEINSRNLYQKWRSEIKAALTDKIYRILTAKNHDKLTFFDGDLDPEYKDRPALCSVLFADSMLRREEYRWKKISQNETPSPNIAELVSIHTSWVDKKRQNNLFHAQIRIRELNSPINFYVCGVAAIPDSCDALIRIDCNGFLSKKIAVNNGNFNCGIIFPVLFRTEMNIITVTIDINGRCSDHDKSDAMIDITHFVIDDQTVYVS